MKKPNKKYNIGINFEDILTFIVRHIVGLIGIGAMICGGVAGMILGIVIIWVAVTFDLD